MSFEIFTRFVKWYTLNDHSFWLNWGLVAFASCTSADLLYHFGTQRGRELGRPSGLMRMVQAAFCRLFDASICQAWADGTTDTHNYPGGRTRLENTPPLPKGLIHGSTADPDSTVPRLSVSKCLLILT